MEPTPEDRITQGIAETPAKVPGTDPARRSKPLTAVESVEVLEKAGVPVPPFLRMAAGVEAGENAMRREMEATGVYHHPGEGWRPG